MKKVCFSICFYSLLSAFCVTSLVSEEPTLKKSETTFETNSKTVQELEWTRVAQKSHKLAAPKEKVPYEVRVDALTMPSKDGKGSSQVYCTSYTTMPIDDSRPLLFCFNGGPGSSSVWLHLGLLGPKKVEFSNLLTPSLTTSTLVQNPESLLQSVDLVFIDPISTGFSRSSKDGNSKAFLGIDEDVCCFAQFIESYLSHFKRWKSPKYLLGESYGTTRAVLLADELHTNHYLDVDGLILISLVLDFNIAIDANPFNELSLISILPSLSVTAQNYGLLSEDLQTMAPLELYNKAKRFAQVELAPALLLGPSLPKEKEQFVASELSHLTGIPSTSIAEAHLRITFKDCKDLLLQKKNIAIGPFDSRMGIPSPYKGEGRYIDPSLSLIASAFTNAMNAYLTQELEIDEKHPYVILNTQSLRDWDWISFQRQGFHPLSPNATAILQEILSKMPSLKIYNAQGLYDTATPPFSQELTLARLAISNPDKRIRSSLFEGGHMMYLDPNIFHTLNNDLREFVTKK